MNPAQAFEFPLVNGLEMSFCSMEIKLGGGLAISGIKSINYDENHSFSKVWGNRPQKQGRTRGQIDPTGSMELLRRQWDALLEFLTVGGAVGYAERSWPLTVSYAEIGAIDTKCDELTQVRFFNAKAKGSEGTDALTVTVDLDIREIIWHGSGAPKRALSPSTILLPRI